MAHDAEASRSSRRSDGDAPRDPGPGAEQASPKARPALGEGDACSPLARMKKKTTSTTERSPFASSPWGFAGATLSLEVPSFLRVGEAEAVALPPEAILPHQEEAAPRSHHNQGGWSNWGTRSWLESSSQRVLDLAIPTMRACSVAPKT
ncbi:hypothetical protein E2562_001176 [Oryza meyeriana var. granulata]|uniref:Uncharacterized protein n=1 Tax=Oryza meyeriana var. granulata TaxID=110450 RepID=A0A6G1DCA0_9ORYZ|nr:hypothetical protein E2562_001176 [Oryza meyeriana var. granulata]